MLYSFSVVGVFRRVLMQVSVLIVLSAILVAKKVDRILEPKVINHVKITALTYMVARVKMAIKNVYLCANRDLWKKGQGGRLRTQMRQLWGKAEQGALCYNKNLKPINFYTKIPNNRLFLWYFCKTGTGFST